MEQFVSAPPPDTPNLETAPPAYDRRDANRSAAENLILERLEHINVNMAALSADVGSLARTVHKVDRNLQILRLIVRLDTHRKTSPSHPSASYTPMSTPLPSLTLQTSNQGLSAAGCPMLHVPPLEGRSLPVR